MLCFAHWLVSTIREDAADAVGVWISARDRHTAKEMEYVSTNWVKRGFRFLCHLKNSPFFILLLLAHQRSPTLYLLRVNGFPNGCKKTAKPLKSILSRDHPETVSYFHS